MSGLFSVMNIATRALAVTQNELRTTGHNIANVDTPGYSRQRVETSTSRPELRATGHLGRGVEQDTVIRITDPLLGERLITEQGLLSSQEKQAELLSRLEELLNEQQVAGVGQGLSALYAAFGDLASASAPGAPVERESLRATATTLVDTIQRLDDDLRALQRDLDGELDASVETINRLSGRIAELNEQIVAQEVMAPANDLRDTRDVLVRELAEYIDVSTFEEDNGSLTVLTNGGLPLVQGNRSGALALAPDPTNPFAPDFSRVVFDLNGVNVDLTNQISGGRLAGQLAGRDGAVADAIRALDTLAYNLIEQTNAVHAAGVGLDGTVGNFFQSVAAVEDAARSLALDANVVSSTDAIAAGLTTDPGDNRNALTLAALRDAAAPLFLPGDPPGPATGPTLRLVDFNAQTVSGVGLQAQAMAGARDQQQQVLDVLLDRRDEISGVNLDEEMVNLIELEKAFQANARIVELVDGLLEDVISLL